MLKSLYAGVSGLTAHQTKMDVIGNNIANVNTFGFKSSRVTFSDMYYQSLRNATAGSAVAGGNNASQVGYGSTVGSIDSNMSRSGFQMTDNGLDLAIAGEGFFQVQDKVGNKFYTRAGVLAIDNYGNLVDSQGNFVLGMTGDPTGQAASSEKIQLTVPDVDDSKAFANKKLLGSNITITSENIGAESNITINFVHGDTPTANITGDNLTITFDQKADYPDLASLDAAIKEAIRLGGVTLPTGELDISVEPAPLNTAAKSTAEVRYGAATSAADTLTFTAGDEGKDGNSIEIKYVEIDPGDTPKAEWNDDRLTFYLVKGDTYTGANLQTYVDAAKTAAAIPTGDVRDIQVTGLTTATVCETITAKPVTLGGGDNTYFENVAGLLGTVKLDGGRVASPQTVGNLTGISVGSDGTVSATHSVHGQLLLGRVDVVTFDNISGLKSSGNNYFVETPASGQARVCRAGFDGTGDIVSSALEMSNVDLAQEFADMITTQRGFQANSRIITTSDELLKELVNLKR